MPLPSQQLSRTEVRAAVEATSVQALDDDAVAFACNLATAMVAGYIRRPQLDYVPDDLLPIAAALAIRIAVNPAQYRRMSVDVEGTSFSATYAPASFSLAEMMVLNKFRKRTA